MQIGRFRLTIALRYYTISMILGTVALAYGSVPLYKMVSSTHSFPGQTIKVLC
jgi:cytochrome c oxidase assembly protein subunit 11